jgi:outer membrane protein assembly factor BamB/predicted MPP superfamily phosphohydrolase
MIKKIFLFLNLLTVAVLFSYGQATFTFAHISDTHIGNQTAEEDLKRTVTSINNNPSISFVVLTGDITEFGSDDELTLAKNLLDNLNKPWYIIPGNHDANWSESGSNSFKKIFGAETFSFISNNYLFVGTASGPNMRMSPGQVPREHIVWLDSVLTDQKNKNLPVIFLNHYPIDSSLNNWYEVIDRLKKRNVQLILCGHGHANRKLNFEGIPAVMGRSNLRAKDSVGGYNIVTIKNGVVTYEATNPVTGERKKWTEVILKKHDFTKDTTKYYRPTYTANHEYTMVKKAWVFQDNSDIGSGTAFKNNMVVASNTNGMVYALNQRTGKKIWEYKTAGKIYATPVISINNVLIASTDNNIYNLHLKTGKKVWEYKTSKPIVANPIIENKTVFIGSSDGHFRAFDISNGQLIWDYDSVKGFVVTKPLFYNNKLFFGSWGTELYALDAATGKPVWKWNNGSANRMFSPAACYPVATAGRLFIVAPDRYMTVFDTETGRVIWRKQDPANRVRESLGMSKDSSLVYAKTMDGDVIGISTRTDTMQITWRAKAGLGYEIAPTAIAEYSGVVYIPSDDGIVTAAARADGKILWKHKVSNALITHILPVSATEIIVTTMDGKVTCLNFKLKVEKDYPKNK